LTTGTERQIVIPGGADDHHHDHQCGVFGSGAALVGRRRHVPIARERDSGFIDGYLVVTVRGVNGGSGSINADKDDGGSEGVGTYAHRLPCLLTLVHGWRDAAVMRPPQSCLAALIVVGATIAFAAAVSWSATLAGPLCGHRGRTAWRSDEVETYSRRCKIILVSCMFFYGYFWTSLFEQSRGGSLRITKVLLGR
jgi:hypothetical protein